MNTRERYIAHRLTHGVRESVARTADESKLSRVEVCRELGIPLTWAEAETDSAANQSAQRLVDNLNRNAKAKA